jgi:hypothetical protein
MGSGKQSGPGGRDDWRVRIAGAVGGLITGALGLLVRSLDLRWPWGLGAFAFVGMIVVGIVLGQLAGRRLFRPASGGPPDPPPHA